MNYAGVVCKIEELKPLENCNNVQAAIIFHNQVIVDLNVKLGDIGVFFPLETQLSENFLSQNNLHRHRERNVDVTKSGFFEDNGRIRAIKFRKQVSEGFFVPLSFLTYVVSEEDLKDFNIGTYFDTINESVVCKKYTIPHKMPGFPGSKNQKKKKIVSRLIEGQFNLHADTMQLKLNLHKISPDNIISLSNKMHGCQATFSNVLVKRQLALHEKILKFMGIRVVDTEYDVLYSSRNVCKNSILGQEYTGFYSEDIWGIVKEELAGKIDKGISLYGEIVGYLPSGGWIQKGYHYGCAAKNHAFYVYRITFTNPDGQVYELTDSQMREYCEVHQLQVVPLYFYGYAGHFTHDVDGVNKIGIETWREQFLDCLTRSFIKNEMCPLNNKEVPEEGIVVRVEKLGKFEAFKLKNWAFQNHETQALDKGEEDIEG